MNTGTIHVHIHANMQLNRYLKRTLHNAQWDLTCKKCCLQWIQAPDMFTYTQTCTQTETKRELDINRNDSGGWLNTYQESIKTWSSLLTTPTIPAWHMGIWHLCTCPRCAFAWVAHYDTRWSPLSVNEACITSGSSKERLSFTYFCRESTLQQGEKLTKTNQTYSKYQLYSKQFFTKILNRHLKISKSFN